MIRYRVRVDDRVYEVEVEPLTQTEIPKGKLENAAESVSAPQGNEVKAPLAGTILSVKVKVGDRVSAGDVLLTLEALKLENEITSPVSGTVVKIASAGETVEADQVIAIIN
ncbi:MAG: DUF2118 domain-containing protein [Firmicutes bacterium]|jgi:biotin carboxyl carrier protein|nr:DUF2118 domain-containing protein [Bacillota bacterium]